MTEDIKIEAPATTGRAVIAKTAAGVVEYESRPGRADSMARVCLLEFGIPDRLITDRFVALVLELVAASPTPCHVIGTAHEAARSVRVALADERGHFPSFITEICDAVDITFE